MLGVMANNLHWSQLVAGALAGSDILLHELNPEMLNLEIASHYMSVKKYKCLNALAFAQRLLNLGDGALDIIIG